MKSKIGILLVFPRFDLCTGDPPLGLAYLAGQLRNKPNIEIEIIDCSLHPSFGYLKKYFFQKKPHITGIFFDTIMFHNGLRVAEIAKKSNSMIIAGGPHATVMPETLIDKFDAVVIGEGEQTFLELIKNYPQRNLSKIDGIWWKNESGEIIKNKPREPIPNLDSLNPPYWEKLEMEEYISRWHYLDCLYLNLRGTDLIASRGCPFNCTYCQPTLRKIFGQTVRKHSPEYIVEQIKYLKKNYNINSFFFHDDTPTADKKWVEHLCVLIEKEQLNIFWAANTRADVTDGELLRTMYNAGLRKLHIGAESGSQRILDEVYKKHITTEDVKKTVELARKIGIHCFCFFMLGAPTETKEEIKKTLKFASTLDIDEISYSITSPLPHTFLYEIMMSNPNYKICNDFSSFNYYSRRAFVDPNLSSSWIKFVQLYGLLTFYLHLKRWKYILKHFTTPNGIKKIFRKVKRVFL